MLHPLSTSRDGAQESVLEERGKLYSLFGVEAPLPVKVDKERDKGSEERKRSRETATDTGYASLVNDAGY